MSLLADPIERSVSALRKLQQARNTLEAEVLADQAKLAELRENLGQTELNALLDNADPEPARRAIAEIEIKIAGRQAARPKLLEKIRAAIKAVGRERAVPLRKKAAELQKKLDAHLAERARLLAELEKFAGIRFVMEFHPIIPPGVAYFSDEIPNLPPPIADRMAGEIRELLATADRAEAQGEQSSQGGVITGGTLAELLAVSEDPETIAPTQAAITAWHAAATARADAEWARAVLGYAGGPAPGREVFYTLVYSDGEIDQAASRAENRELRAPVPWMRPAQLPVRQSGY
jgi:hypothetical protein